LTGHSILRAVDQLHLLEFHSARSKDWPVNRQGSSIALEKLPSMLLKKWDLTTCLMLLAH
jgi:hypothetical protein